MDSARSPYELRSGARAGVDGSGRAGYLTPEQKIQEIEHQLQRNSRELRRIDSSSRKVDRDQESQHAAGQQEKEVSTGQVSSTRELLELEELEMMRTRRRAEEARLQREEEAHRLRLRRDEENHKVDLEKEYQETELLKARRSREENEQKIRTEELEVTKQSAEERAVSDIRIESLKDTDDVDAYIAHFERVATLCRWRESSWAARLVALLHGKTRDAILRLTPTDLEDYQKVKRALLTYFRLDAEAYRRKFRTMTKMEGETWGQMLDRLKACFKLWCLSAEKDENNADDIKDMLFQEQLYSIFSPRFAEEVRRQQPESAEAVAHEATVYAEAKRYAKKHTAVVIGGGRYRDPENSEHPGSKVVLEKQSQQDSKDTPPTKLGNQRYTEFKPICYKCKKEGHIARNCPQEQVAFLRDERHQEEIGHVPSLCIPCAKKPYDPRCTVFVEGTATRAIRDTGASQTVVAARLVPKDSYSGEHQTVVLAESRSHCVLPVVWVYMDTPFFFGRVRALVMEKPVEDVLIGNWIQREGESASERVSVYATRELSQQAPVPRAEQVAVMTRAQAAKRNTPLNPLSVKAQAMAVNKEDLTKMQSEDSTLAAARQAADRGTVFASRGNEIKYIRKDKVLTREFQGGKGVSQQICVPKPLRNTVLKLGHDIPMAGHLGGSKTKERIVPHFYWPGMCGDIGRYVRSCPTCQRTIDRGRVRPASIVKMTAFRDPFDRVGVDIVGPITPASTNGNRYLLVQVDFATRYPEATPLRHINTESVAEALFTMWSRTGVPVSVLTDRGTQFTSDVMEQVMRLLSIKGVKTTPYHAQCNGLVERFNGTLKKMLRRLVQDKPEEWDRWVPALLFAYREVPQESTGFSPFELLYGRRVRGPMLILKELWQKPENMDLRTAAEYVFELRNRIAESCGRAQINLSKAAARYKHHFDRKAKPRVLQPGSRVLILRPVKNNKLELAWQGPYPVTARVGEADYRVRVRGGKEKLYHVNLLKQYVERDPDHKNPTVATAVITDHEVCEVAPTVKGEIPCLPLEATETWKDVVISTKDPTFREELQATVENFHDVFTDLPGTTDLESCAINLEDDVPVRVRPYPVPYSQRESIKKEIELMLRMGAIEKSYSPYCSPVVLVKKKDGKIRFCVDYRKLNRIVVFDAEPMPEIDYLFAKLGERRIFSKLDLSKGYWQIPVRQEDRPKTAFSTPEGHFQWAKMPFGLCTSGAVFTRMMRKLLQPLESDEVDNFIDDVLITTVDTQEHIKILKAVLTRLRECGLTARPSKCELGSREVSYLGHRIGEGTIRPEEDKMERILQATRPSTKKEVRSFLGLVGFYRRYIPNFSNLALPLTDLTKGRNPRIVSWDETCEKAFQALKRCFCSPPVCHLPVKGLRYILKTDASGTGIGAVLCQSHPDGIHPVMCASKKLDKAEKNYSIIEKECLAIVWAVQRFEPYLYGVEFTIQTDHSPLQYLERVKSPSGRITRWAMLLQPFRFHVEAIPGKDNVAANYLSRQGETCNRETNSGRQ